MQITSLSGRDYLTLSGGEAQKVHMCRVLAQIGEDGEVEGKFLFLDEPVSHLDLKYQYALLRAARELCSVQHTVIAVLHDINLALSFADRILFMKQGNIAYDVQNVRAVSEAIIEDVFDIKAHILYPEPERPVVMVDHFR